MVAVNVVLERGPAGGSDPTLLAAEGAVCARDEEGTARREKCTAGALEMTGPDAEVIVGAVPWEEAEVVVGAVPWEEAEVVVEARSAKKGAGGRARGGGGLVELEVGGSEAE